jgi:MFS family permease
MERLEQPFTKAQRRTVVTLAMLGTLLDGVDFTIMLYFLAPIARYFHVPLTQVAAIQAVSYIAGVAGGILFGVVADRWGRRLGLTLTVGLFSLLSLVAALSPNFAFLFVVKVLMGVPIGGETGIAMAYLNEALPGRSDRRGLATGALQGMFQLGLFVTIGIFTYTQTHFGAEAWRYAFGVLGLGALAAGLIRMTMPESRLWLAARSAGAVVRERPVLGLFRGGLASTTIVASLLLTAVFFAGFAFGTYSPATWQSVYHLPAGTVALIGAVGSIISIAGYLLAGVLSDAIGRRTPFVVLPAFGAVAGVAFLLLATTTPIAVVQSTFFLASPVVLLALLLLLGNPLGGQGSWLGELFPTALRSTGINLPFYAGRAIGGGLLPYLGLLAVTAAGLDLRYTVIFAVVANLFAIGLSFGLHETRGVLLQPTDSMEVSMR